MGCSIPMNHLDPYRSSPLVLEGVNAGIRAYRPRGGDISRPRLSLSLKQQQEKSRPSTQELLSLMRFQGNSSAWWSGRWPYLVWPSLQEACHLNWHFPGWGNIQLERLGASAGADIQILQSRAPGRSYRSGTLVTEAETDMQKKSFNPPHVLLYVFLTPIQSSRTEIKKAVMGVYLQYPQSLPSPWGNIPTSCNVLLSREI